MNTTAPRKSKRRAAAAPTVPVADKLRWSLSEAAAMSSICPNTLRALLGRGEYPPRVRIATGDEDDGKLQFVASEVRAWADGRDWRAMVAARLGVSDAP